MSPKTQPDPFQKWRDEQRDASPRAGVASTTRPTLSPGREARRDLAIYAAVDAVRNHDPDARDRVEELLRVDTHVRAEQAAETGHVPETFEGCIAVLNAAAAIMEALGGDE